MPRTIKFYAALLILGLATGTSRGQAPAGEMEMHHGVRSTVPLHITFGDNSAEWPLAKLASLPHTSISVFNEHAKATQTYSGVPLTDLLTQLGVPAKPRGKDFRIYLVAQGADGYQVAYSLGEVTPDVHDGTVLVADQVDGKPLGENGDFQLVLTGEKRPARWVRNLVAIRVLTAE
jgi:hypothetical protein